LKILQRNYSQNQFENIPKVMQSIKNIENLKKHLILKNELFNSINVSQNELTQVNTSLFIGSTLQPIYNNNIKLKNENNSEESV
jgi:hypothetical protein